MSENKHTIGDLYQMQSLSLESKVRMTQWRIKQWVEYYGEDGVYVSFSGGKDSTVLLDIVRNVCGYKNVEGVFCDTSLEYPEIREFVKQFENIRWIKPMKNFKRIIEEEGYPIFSKPISNTVKYAKKNIEQGVVTTRVQKIKGDLLDNDGKKSLFNNNRYAFLLDAPFDVSDKCCEICKKHPTLEYEKETGKHPMLGMMAEESKKRRDGWLKTGCNAYDLKRPQSNPMAFWTEQDVLLYIKENNLQISSIYGDIVYVDDDGMEYDNDVFNGSMKLKTTGCERTGCMYCLFGIHLEREPNRLQQMKLTHPKQYDYIMRPKEQGGLNYKEVIDWINEHGNMHIKY